MLKNTLRSLLMLIVMTVLLGIIYPFLITGISSLFFNNKANGSLIKIDNKIIGSKLLGQKFTSDKYFWGRPSASDYGTIPSGASNQGYTSAVLKQNIEDRKKLFSSDSKKETPKDLLFASASGVDPDISPEAAMFQAERVAMARNYSKVEKKSLEILIKKSIIKRQFFILGEERVNVLLLNMELDKIK